MRKKVGLKLFLLVVFSLLMPIISGVVIGVGGVSDQGSIYLIQFIAIFSGVLILLLILKCSSFSFKEMGFGSIKIGSWIIGVILMEALVAAFGFHSDMSLRTIVLLILFMGSVGVFEELLYRGFVLKYLSARNPRTAVYLSAALFGIGHIANLLGGADPVLTVVQIIFAFLFGVVCAEIVLSTGSMMFVIIWHAVHNILNNLSAHPSMNIQMFMVAVQCVILAVLAYQLRKKRYISEGLKTVKIVK